MAWSPGASLAFFVNSLLVYFLLEKQIIFFDFCKYVNRFQ